MIIWVLILTLTTGGELRLRLTEIECRAGQAVLDDGGVVRIEVLPGVAVEARAGQCRRVELRSAAAEADL